MAKKKAEVDYEKNLKERFKRWNYLKECGGNDPFWSDGCNMNLVRNHILYYKGEIEKNCPPDEYPAIYFQETPPVMDNDYMARPDEIRQNAKKTLVVFEQDDNLKFIKRKMQSIDNKFMKQISAGNVAGYAISLRNAIAKNDLVTMRRFERYEHYLESFKNCADKIREYKPPVNEQISLFDYIDDEAESFEMNM